AAAQRLAWLHQTLPGLPGTGIIYCLTLRDVEQVTQWLRSHGHHVLPYTGGTDGDDRLDAEARLQRNEVKALVATSALGMGYDKPDLAFVVHFQAPGSPVAYYQQVGRAGRQLEQSAGILLRGAEDREIQDWFIETAFPDAGDVDAVLAVFAFAEGPVTLGRILDEVNMRRGDVELVLKQLTVEGVLRRLSGQTYERTLKPWTYPAERVAAVTADRRLEQQQMATYARGETCRMEFLTGVLDDPRRGPCGVCDVCSGSRHAIELDESLVAEAERYLRRGYALVEPRKQRFGKKLADDLRLEPGRALCLWNDAGWGRLVAQGRDSGHFDDRLIASVADMVDDWSPRPMPTWVTYVPSLRRPGVVPDLARRIAERMGLPLVDIVEKVRETPPQKRQQNGAHQERNVQGAFRLRAAPSAEPVFLVDDTVDSRWTLTEIGALLREKGSGPVHPLVLASLQGRDS
ncbi:MAG: helicase-related protein, partial [Ilumatobacteraceae bacterium]